MIFPYALTDQGWTIPEYVMVEIYNKMSSCDLIKTVFPSGGGDNLNKFLEYYKRRSNVVHVLLGNDKIDGIVWLNNWRYNSASGHFCFFPHTWGKSAKETGRKVIKYWFDTFNTKDLKLDVIFGKIPATNKRAVKFAQEIGLTKIGEIGSIRYKGDKGAKGVVLLAVERSE